jgi:hypothetical protein
MKVRFTQGQTYYNEILVVNRGDFQMAKVTLDPSSRLYTAWAFDWSKGPPYFENVIATDRSIDVCRKAIKDFLEPIAEPPAY